MPIGTPTSIGSASSSSANISSASFTTTGNIPAGSLVWVVIAFASGTVGQSVSSVTDGTNTYTKVDAATGTNFTVDCEVWQCPNASAVSSGATLTATLSGTTTGSNGYYIQAFTVTGLATPICLDKHANQSGTNTATPSVSSGTLSQASEIAIGTSYVFQNSSATPFTESSGFSTLTNAALSGPFSVISVSYQIVNATTSITYAPTWNAGGTIGTCTVLSTFEGAAAVTNDGYSTQIFRVARGSWR